METPVLDFIVVLAKLKNGNTHQVLLKPENRLALANIICQMEGSIRLQEDRIEGVEIGDAPLPDISKMKRDDVVPHYADLIRHETNPMSERVGAFNQAIISKWSDSALIYIKEKAWKLVN